MSIDQERTRQYWDDRHFDPGYSREEWSFHPAAKARLHRLLGAFSREEWFWTKYLSGKSGLRGVGIGVGLGQTELRLVSSGAFAQYDFYDVSPAALEQVKRDAEKIGVSDKIRCICADIDALELGVESYDLVTFIASLHHMNDLPDILGKCKAALRPGGRLWAVEYIGPDRFQFPDKDTEFAKRFYRSVHPGLKKIWMPELQFPSAEEVIKGPTRRKGPFTLRKFQPSFMPRSKAWKPSIPMGPSHSFCSGACCTTRSTNRRSARNSSPPCSISTPC